MKPRFASLVSFHTRHTLVAFGQFRGFVCRARPFSSSAFRSFPRRGWSQRIEVTPVWIFVVCVSSSCLRSSLEVDSFWEAMDKFVDPIELLRLGELWLWERNVVLTRDDLTWRSISLFAHPWWSWNISRRDLEEFLPLDFPRWKREEVTLYSR